MVEKHVKELQISKEGDNIHELGYIDIKSGGNRYAYNIQLVQGTLLYVSLLQHTANTLRELLFNNTAYYMK